MDGGLASKSGGADVAHHEENILRTIGTQAALPTHAGSAARLSKRNGQDVKFFKVVQT